MNTDRLNTLADFLRTVPQERFNINFWSNEIGSCGTIFCAGGWACQISEFQQAGLNMSNGTPQMLSEEIDEEIVTGVQALAQFFSLTIRQAERIFYRQYYEDKYQNVTIAMVLDRIRGMVLAAHIEALKEVLKQVGQADNLPDRIMRAGTVTFLATQIELEIRKELHR